MSSTTAKYLRAGIYEEFLELSLDSYKAHVRPRQLGVIKHYIANISQMRAKGLGLFLYGPQGVGKTGLMMEVLKAAIDSGFTAQFSSLSGIITKFSDSWYSMEARQELYEAVRSIDFLGIDDVGKEYETKKGLETTVLDSVIRYRSMRLRPIIQTSNISVIGLKDRFSEYIASLMQGNLIPVKMIGEDFRSIKYRKNMEEFESEYKKGKDKSTDG